MIELTHCPFCRWPAVRVIIHWGEWAMYRGRCLRRHGWREAS